MIPSVGLVLVAGTSVFFSVVGALLVRRYPDTDKPPALVTLGFSLAVGVAFVVTAFPWIMGISIVPVNSRDAVVGGYGPVMIKLCFSMLLYSYPVVLITQLVGARFTAATVDGIYWSGVTTRPLSSYGRAHTQLMDGNPGAALREFQTYFDADPTIPDPLFHAGAMLDERKRYMEAIQIYRQLRTLFEKDLRIWAVATLRLVDIFEHGLGKPKEARKFLYELLRRAKDPALRELVTNRLGAMPDGE